MRTEDAMTAEVVELLRTLIRNACVNDGTDASGHEIRSADTLEAYLSGVGLAMERYTAAPGRVSLVTRIDGRDRRAPTLRCSATPTWFPPTAVAGATIPLPP